ncbi:uncharacterized protein LOC116848023 [Odontomachus brunneus]|uniref:uncharacterized protein LOC116848023 n=1 Tax=Odontomachus brunneus TaxID=486640 RepID=UPI0013F1FC87|nr:uncharacterized protein LOC116848023 [Odontomachus brunneus]
MNIETVDISPFRAKSNTMPSQQIYGNMSMAEALPKSFPYTYTSLSSSSANIYEKACVQNTQEQAIPMSQVATLRFAEIIYSCGNYRYKNDHDAQALVINLSQHKELYSEGMQFLENKFSNGTVLPIFLKKLHKIVEFEAIIGLLPGKSEVMTQLMAPKDCIHLLFHLLLYWLNLPFSEKQNGLDVNLPMNTGHMWNFLKDLNLLHFYKDIKNPLWLLDIMDNLKSNLHNMSKNEEYFRMQTCVQDIQSELLAFIHTHPEPSTHFRKIVAYTEILKCRVMTRQLDAATYLGILLSYNNICTPHTPPNLRNILKHIVKPFPEKQFPKKQEDLMQEEFPLNANPTHSVPFATSFFHTPQKINITVNPNAVTNVRNVTHNTSNIINVKDVDIYQSGISSAIKNYMQYYQNILPLDVEPISIQSGNTKRSDSRWSTDNININTNLPMTNPNINMIGLNASVSLQSENSGEKYNQWLINNLNINTNLPEIKSNASNQSDNQKYLSTQASLVSSSEEQIPFGKFVRNAKKIEDQARAFQTSPLIKAIERLERLESRKKLKLKYLRKVENMIIIENNRLKQLKILHNHCN